MANFLTILLVDQAKGADARIDFCKRLEANHAKSRRPDSERPLVKIDGSRSGDTTVMYDKGGLGLLDAAESDGPRAGLAWPPEFHHDLPWQPRSPRAPGHPGGHAQVRSE